MMTSESILLMVHMHECDHVIFVVGIKLAKDVL